VPTAALLEIQKKEKKNIKWALGRGTASSSLLSPNAPTTSKGDREPKETLHHYGKKAFQGSKTRKEEVLKVRRKTGGSRSRSRFKKKAPEGRSKTLVWERTVFSHSDIYLLNETPKDTPRGQKGFPGKKKKKGNPNIREIFLQAARGVNRDGKRR